MGADLLDGGAGSDVADYFLSAAAVAIDLAAGTASGGDAEGDTLVSIESVIGTDFGDTLPLSGGQVQRIALARAVYGKPALVVLDEPNANLDADGDAALRDAILALRQAGTTVVVIAHRPSAIAAVDTILMLNAGRQTDFGPKSEVLSRVARVVDA